jgi:trimethylamine:corrinoid methyltransferase-like protein
MYDAWLKDGGTDIQQRAHEKALDILENHKVEPLPEPIQKEIQSILQEAIDELNEERAKV